MRIMVGCSLIMLLMVGSVQAAEMRPQGAVGATVDWLSATWDELYNPSADPNNMVYFWMVPTVPAVQHLPTAADAVFLHKGGTVNLTGAATTAYTFVGDRPFYGADPNTGPIEVGTCVLNVTATGSLTPGIFTAGGFYDSEVNVSGTIWSEDGYYGNPAWSNPYAARNVTGTININTGGLLNCSDDLFGARTDGTNSVSVIYNLQGGSIYVHDQNQLGKNGGYTELNVSAGTYTQTNDIAKVGSSAGSTSVVNLSGTGNMNLGARDWRHGDTACNVEFNYLGGTFTCANFIMNNNLASTATLYISQDASHEKFQVNVLRLRGGPTAGYVTGMQTLKIDADLLGCGVINTNYYQMPNMAGNGTHAELIINSAASARPHYGDKWMVINLTTNAGEGNATNWSDSQIKSNLIGGAADWNGYFDANGDYWVEFIGATGADCAGDPNYGADGQVNVSDLGRLSANWNTGSGKDWGTGDWNDDGYCDTADLGILSANWGWSGGDPYPAAPAPVPEPATMVMLGLGGLALIRRRR